MKATIEVKAVGLVLVAPNEVGGLPAQCAKVTKVDSKRIIRFLRKAGTDTGRNQRIILLIGRRGRSAKNFQVDITTDKLRKLRKKIDKAEL